jgi:hypothetical protein
VSHGGNSNAGSSPLPLRMPPVNARRHGALPAILRRPQRPFQVIRAPITSLINGRAWMLRRPADGPVQSPAALNGRLGHGPESRRPLAPAAHKGGTGGRQVQAGRPWPSALRAGPHRERTRCGQCRATPDGRSTRSAPSSHLRRPSPCAITGTRGPPYGPGLVRNFSDHEQRTRRSATRRSDQGQSVAQVRTQLKLASHLSPEERTVVWAICELSPGARTWRTGLTSASSHSTR